MTTQEKVKASMPFIVRIKNEDGRLSSGILKGKEEKFPLVQYGSMNFEISWDLAHRLLTRESKYISL